MLATEALGLGDEAEDAALVASRECRHVSEDTSICVWTPASPRATLETYPDEEES